MKRLSLFAVILGLSALFGACTESSNRSTTSSSESGSASAFPTAPWWATSTPSSTGPVSTPPPGQGSSCTYTSGTVDCPNCTNPIENVVVSAHGHVEWFSTGAGYGFYSDGRLRVRAKVLARPALGLESNGTTTECNQLHVYNRLSFTLGNKLRSTDSLQYAVQVGGDTGINVGTCSSIIDMPTLGGLDYGNPNPLGTPQPYPQGVTVTDVKSDFYCSLYRSWGSAYQEYIDAYCETKRTVETSACWSLELHIVTDKTKNF